MDTVVQRIPPPTTGVHTVSGHSFSISSFERLVERIERLGDQMEKALAVLSERQTAKVWYTTAEVSEAVARSEYTVREWCRKGQVPADKAPNGRGWLIATETLSRIRNGELPLPEHTRNRVLNG